MNIDTKSNKTLVEIQNFQSYHCQWGNERNRLENTL